MNENFITLIAGFVGIIGLILVVQTAAPFLNGTPIQNVTLETTIPVSTLEETQNIFHTTVFSSQATSVSNLLLFGLYLIYIANFLGLLSLNFCMLDTDYLADLLPQLRFIDRKSTRLNSSHSGESRMPSSA